MTKACVLCPGPSLTRTFSEDMAGEYDLVLGVNRVAQMFECDFWVVLDAYTFGMTEVRGCPVIVTGAKQYETMCVGYPDAQKHEHLDHKKIKVPIMEVPWRSKGLLTAVIVAYSKGAKVIDCYGVDLKGTADFDGKTFDRQMRSANRWRKERKKLARLTRALARLGTVVTRVEDKEIGELARP